MSFLFSWVNLFVNMLLCKSIKFTYITIVPKNDRSIKVRFKLINLVYRHSY